MLGVRYARKPRFVRPYLRDMYRRRLAQGPEVYRPRSDWFWNRDSELSAFLYRIGEKIALNNIDVILTDQSYTSFWSAKRAESNNNMLLNNMEFSLS
ncbi:unnamed protein product, partial [Heterobilharzia americana]